MKNKLNECIKNNQIKFTGKIKDPTQELNQANFFLDEAFDLIELNKKEMSIIALYNSAFHCARSILFNDGYDEHSHYCLQIYLIEKTNLKNEYIELFDILRGQRTQVQYATEKIKIEENLDELYNKVEDFIEETKKIIKVN
jgi:uncharacterized protein (UPF0332 family)